MWRMFFKSRSFKKKQKKTVNEKKKKEKKTKPLWKEFVCIKAVSAIEVLRTSLIGYF